MPRAEINTENKITIAWNTLTVPQWRARFAAVRRSTVSQSYDYARAMAPLSQQRARWGLIKIDGQEAGLVQILEARAIGGALHGLIIDRGPLWFEGFGNQNHAALFAQEIDRIFPARFGRKRRFIPEMQTPLNVQGFELQKDSSYETIWLDLTEGLETLRNGLKSNWRNKVSRAEREGLRVEWSQTYEHLPWVLLSYQHDRQLKNYKGANLKTLRALATLFATEGNLLIGRTMKDGEAVAGAMILCHGTSATYQVGFNDEKGRKIGAHNLLLWDALRFLRDKNIKDFDLGGVNDESAKGVKEFKTGMGGTLVRLPGIYR